VTKIFVVEDNEMNLDMVSRRLVRAGFEVASAMSAVGIVERLRAEQPDLVLLDLGLPEVDGFAATRAIRNDPALCTLPIIALTAHALTTDRDRALEAGCNDFTTKPVDFTNLVARIRALLERGPNG
jgi:two-component system cell cycle response regulator DivK